ncbi:MAG TPA: hypothetical protein VGP68_11055, partial [Gemmataceae bacterium]|nr:hypothetical protein [Gemmataceae bacterium]
MRCSRAFGLCILLAASQSAWAQTPSVRLGKPQAIGATQTSNYAPPAESGPVPSLYPNLLQADFAPSAAQGGIVQTQAQDFPAPPPVIPSTPAIGVPAAGGDAYNCGVVTQNPASPTGFWDGVQQWCKGLTNGFQGNGRKMFQSDHCFDTFISPVTNPFYFEDPRSLTELRPVFIFQGVPGGGNIFDLSLQGRLAITDRFSIVINKLGYIDATGGNEDFHGGSFSELWLGPKFTFLRSESTYTVAAVGLTFEIPAGGSNMAQNTGSLSLDPYVSLAQRIYDFKGVGTLNGMGTLGYSFRTDDERSEKFYLSLHLDFDVGDLHRIYPLMEMNYFHYTRNGNQEPFNFEGKDLINIGSEFVAGKNDLSLAGGVRFKVNDFWQIGVAADFPVAGNKDLMNYRILFDMI